LGFEITGGDDPLSVGWSVGDAGDVNGDGIADFLLGAPGQVIDATMPDRGYVIYGRPGGPDFPLDRVNLDAATGTVIQGETVEDRFGYGASSADNVNGDGFDDFVGGAYVMYGGRDGPGLLATPALSLTSIDLGQARANESSKRQVVTVTNTSERVLTLGQLSFAGSDGGAFEFVNDNCSNNDLASGEIGAFTVAVRLGMLGDFSASVNIPHSAAAPQSISMTTSVQPPLPVPALWGKTPWLLAGIMSWVSIRRLKAVRSVSN